MKGICRILAGVALALVMPATANALYCANVKFVNGTIGSNVLIYNFFGHCSITESSVASSVIESGNGNWDAGTGTAHEFFEAKHNKPWNAGTRIRRTNVVYGCNANPWGNSEAKCQLKTCESIYSPDDGKYWFKSKGTDRDGCTLPAFKKAKPITRHLVPAGVTFGTTDPPTVFQFSSPSSDGLSWAADKQLCVGLFLHQSLASQMATLFDAHLGVGVTATLTWTGPDNMMYAPWSGSPPALPGKILIGNRGEGLFQGSYFGHACAAAASPVLASSPGLWTVRACIDKAPMQGGSVYAACIDRKINIVKAATAKDAPPSGPMQAMPKLPPLPGAGAGGRGSGQSVLPPLRATPAAEPRSAPTLPPNPAAATPPVMGAPPLPAVVPGQAPVRQSPRSPEPAPASR